MLLQLQVVGLLFWAASAAADLAEPDLSTSGELLAVVQLFRHGHRTPTAYYKNDPYADPKYWDGLDFGQLTNKGKQQHYDLAKFTRKLYGEWLPQRYDKNDFYAQTTDVDRTHMSGQANIYGLYPAKRDQKWRGLSDWQPIPIHPGDANIWESYPNCEDYATEYVQVLFSDFYKNIDKENAELYAYLSKYSGENITSLSDAYIMFDCFKSESTAGLRLPKWASKVYPQPLTKLVGYQFKAMGHTQKQQRYYTGTLLDSILKYFDNKINGTVTQKFKMYSGHDSNIAAILNALDAFNPPYPPEFASSIYFELRKKSNNYFVNVWSKDGSKFEKVSIRGCALDCPLDEANIRLREIALDVTTRKQECSEQIIIDNGDVANMYRHLVESGEIERLKNMF